MTTLTEQERACLLTMPSADERYAFVPDMATAERLAKRGYAQGKRVAFCNYPLVKLSNKGAKAVAR